MNPLAQVHLPAPSMRRTRCIAEVFFDAGHLEVYLQSAQAGFPRTKVLDHTLANFTGFEGYLGVTGSSGGVTGMHYIDDLQVVVGP